MPAMVPASAMPAASGAVDAGASRNRFAPPDADLRGRLGAGDSTVLSQEEAWAAVVGDAKADYYVERFERLSRGEGGGWHWPAMFVTWGWMLYRKLWVSSLIYFFAPYVVFRVVGAVLASSPTILVVATLAVWLAFFIVPARSANGWYFEHCKKKIRDVRARGGSREQMLARLESAGGTSNVMIVVAFFGLLVGIGILAAVSLPAYQQYTVKAKMAEAVQVGDQVAAAVGQQYQQTGALPAAGDVDRLATSLARQPNTLVRGADIDPLTGVLKIKVEPLPNQPGSIDLVPTADASRHLTWTCTSEGIKPNLVPPSCRGPGAASR